MKVTIEFDLSKPEDKQHYEACMNIKNCASAIWCLHQLMIDCKGWSRSVNSFNKLYSQLILILDQHNIPFASHMEDEAQR